MLPKYPRPKISEFYRNISNPTNPQPVTVDTWAAKVWTGQIDRDAVTVLDNESTRIGDDYRVAAGIADLLPQELQAIVWIAAHRIVREAGQRSLFEVGLAFKI